MTSYAQTSKSLTTPTILWLFQCYLKLLTAATVQFALLLGRHNFEGILTQKFTFSVPLHINWA